MNLNNGKTGTVNIPGALHSTGGDGDGHVGNVVAYAGDVYDENLENNQADINKSTIKLDEYDNVNITHPLSEKIEGQILCHLKKDDEKIIQDHSDWGSEFPDYVRSHNLYIATDMGNTGIYFPEDGEFGGYIVGEEIANVTDSSNKSVIVNCFESAKDYWIIETKTELTINNMPYYGLARYYQTHDITPFRLEQDGSLRLMGVGGYDGDESNAYDSQSLQEVISGLEEQVASASTSGGGVTSWNDLEDKPTILDSNDVTQIAIEKSALHYDDDNSNFVTYVPNGTNSAYTTNTITETTDAIIQGQNNNIQYGNSSVILGHDNTLEDEESIIVGHDNSSNDYNTIILGTYNENTENYSVLIGDYNHNDSTYGVLLGNNNYCWFFIGMA